MRTLLVIMLVFSLFGFVGCDSAPDAEEPALPEVEDPAGTEDNGITEPLMGQSEGPISIDGSNAGYPSAGFQVLDADIYLAYDDSNIYVYLEAEGEGWVSVGFNSSGGGMNGANMIIGYLDGDTAAIRDDVGQGRSHSEASSSVVKEYFFAQENGMVIMEFSYPLNFQDGEGYNLSGLEPGETYSLIFAANSSSNNVNQHDRRGSIDFTVEP
jgi:hypothetical protein